MDLLVVEHPKTGETYAVPAAHFRKELEPDGWKAVRHESGKSYEPPQATKDTAKTDANGSPKKAAG